MDGPAPGARPRAPLPASPVLASHGSVVRVPRLRAQAGPHSRRPDRVAYPPLAAPQLPAQVRHPQRKVAVLPVRPGEPLVEPASVGERGAPVSHVRGDPPGGGQPERGALRVGRPPSGWPGHRDGTLDPPHVRLRLVELDAQLPCPVPAHHDVVVEEDHPLGGHRRPPPGVPRGGRAPPIERDHGHPVRQRCWHRHGKRGGSVPPVVREHHLAGRVTRRRHRRGERVQARLKRRAAHRGDHGNVAWLIHRRPPLPLPPHGKRPRRRPFEGATRH